MSSDFQAVKEPTTTYSTYADLKFLFQFNSHGNAEYKRYLEFSFAQMSVETVHRLILIATFFQIILAISAVMKHSSLDDEKSIAVLIFACLSLIIGFVGWVLVYLIMTERGTWAQVQFLAILSKLDRQRFECCYILIFTLFLCFRLILVTWIGQCGSSFLDQSGILCNHFADCDSPPIASLVTLMFVPPFIATCLRDISYQYVVVCWILVMVCLAVINLMTGTSILWAPAIIVFYAIVSGFAQLELHRQNLRLFHATEHLKYVLRENERLATESHQDEMRHMIGNVAHDLKTPLASFLTGIECIVQVATDMRSRTTISPRDQTFTDAMNEIPLILECAENLKNTNSFMLMTINRCIDYTKVKNGVKLVPCMETVNLIHALQLPLKIMRSLQKSINIKVTEVAPDIFSHIITDKQWLQENLLCLLSNAVKYSTEGTVEISLDVISELPDTDESMGSSGILPAVSRGYAADDDSLFDLEMEMSGCSLEQAVHKPVHKVSRHRAILAKVTPGAKSPKNTATTGNMGATAIAYANVNSNEQSSYVLPVVPNSSSLNSSGVNSYQFHSQHLHRQQPPHNKLLPENHCFLRINIQDHGVGLSPDAMRILFSPFKQAQRLAGGTGLGLFSLARRVESLNGACGVHQRADGLQGCVFWFAIPYRPHVRAVGGNCVGVPTSAAADIEATVGGDGNILLPPRSHSNLQSPYSSTTCCSKQRSQHQPLSKMPIVHHFNMDDTRSGKISAVKTPSLAATTVSVSNSASMDYIQPVHATLSVDHFSTDATDETGAQTRYKHSIEVHPYSSRTTQPSSYSCSTDLSDSIEHNASSHSPSTVKKVHDISLCGSSGESSKSIDGDKKDTVVFSASVATSIGKVSDIPLRIMIVDDSPLILKMTTMMLRRQGHSIVSAQNGAIGLNKIIEYANTGMPFDVILMDLQMPVMDGLEATRNLRDYERQQRMKQTPAEAMERLLMKREIVTESNPSNSSNGIHGDFDSCVVEDLSVDGSISITKQCGAVDDEEDETSVVKKDGYSSKENGAVSLASGPVPPSPTLKGLHKHLVVGFSANSDSVTKDAAFAAGIDTFISKPFTMQAFYNAVYSHLQCRKVDAGEQRRSSV